MLLKPEDWTSRDRAALYGFLQALPAALPSAGDMLNVQLVLGSYVTVCKEQGT